MSEELAKLKVVIEAPLQGLKKDLGRIKQTMRSATSDVQKDLDKIRNPLKGKMKKLQIKMGVKVQTDEFKSLNNDIEKVESSLKRLRMEEFELRKAGENKGLSEKYRKVQKSADEAQKSLDALLLKKKKLDESGEGYEFSTKYQKMYDSRMEANENLRNLLRERDRRKISGISMMDIKPDGTLFNIEDEISKTRKKITELSKDMESMEEKGKMLKPTKAMENLEEKIQSAADKIGKYKSEMADLTSDGLEDGTEEWIKNQKAIEKCTEDLERYKSIKNDMERSGTDVQKNKGLGGTTKFLGGMKKTMNEVSDSIKMTSGAFGALIQRFKTGIPLLKGFNSGLNRSNDSMHRGLIWILKYGIGVRSLFALANRMRGALVEGFQNLSQYSDRTNRSISVLMSSMTQLKNAWAAAFSPILNVVAPILDILIQKIISAVNFIGQLMSALTGGSTYIRAKKVNLDYAASLDKNTSSANKANQANKELQKTILGFDQINKMSDNTSGINSGGIAAGGLSPEDMFETDQIPGKVNNLAQMIKDAWKKADFTEIGEIVAEKLNDSLVNIPWVRIKGTSDRIARSVVTFINGFVGKADWHMVGISLAEGINTGVDFLNGLIGADGIDFDMIGTKLSIGLRGSIGRINWTNLGNLLGNKFMMSWKILDGFVTNMSKKDNAGLTGWKQLGRSIANSANGLFKTINFGQIGYTLTTGLNGVFETLREFTATFDWKEAADNVKDGLNTAFKTLKWEEAGASLEEFLDKLDTFMIDVASGTDWEEFGRGIGEFLSEIDWKQHFENLFQVLKEILSGIWDGLGTTSAGKFVQAIVAFKIGMRLMPFVNSIIRFFTGSTVVGLMSQAIQNMLGKSVTDGAKSAAKALGEAGGAAETAGKSFSIFNNPLITTVAKTGAVYGAAILGGIGIGKMSDAAYGGNAKLSELGGGIDNLINQLADWGYITGEQHKQLFMLKEELEDSNAPIEEYKKSFIDMLTSMGVSSGEAYNAFMSFSGGTDAQISMLTGIVEGLGKTTEAMAGSTTASLQKVERETTTAMNNTGKAYTNIQSVIGTALGTIMKNSGIAWTGIKDAAVGSLSTVLKKAKETMPGVEGLTKSSFGAVKNTTYSEWGEAEKTLLSAVGNMDSETTQKMSSMDSTVISKQASIKSYMVRSWKDLDETITQKLGNMGTNAERYLSSMVDTFASMRGRIQKAVGDLSSIGRNAAKSFASGISSVHIPMPHISVKANTTKGESGYSYNMDSRVNWYASGGFPNAGDLFIANDDGPEMVGKMGHKNTVANNGQIVEGIKAGVYEAVTEALVSMKETDDGNRDVTIILEGDAKGLFKVIRKEGQNYQKSTGKPVFE